MDVRWLTAPEHEVAAAMATVRHTSRPAWVPTKRQLIVHVNQCLILWYLCIVFLVFGVQVDSFQNGHIEASNLPGMLVTMLILAAWLYGTFWLRRWAARPPSPRARLAEWRQTLTALANGCEPRPSDGATFSALVTSGARRVREYPRFVAPGFEFGNLSRRGSARTTDWHYLMVTLPAPLPHLVLDATSGDRLGGRSDLPTGVDRGQIVSLEGDFDRWFRVYSPVTYRTEALYVLTPDVMAALIDDASGFDVEIVDDRLVFFAPTAVDFGTPAPWSAVGTLLGGVVPRLAAKSARYLDERVPGQEVPRVIRKIAAELEHPGRPWIAPAPRISPEGRRLDLRDAWRPTLAVLGAIGWFATLTLLYAVPGIFAFAGFMSIVDGR